MLVALWLVFEKEKTKYLNIKEVDRGPVKSYSILGDWWLHENPLSAPPSEDIPQRDWLI